MFGKPSLISGLFFTQLGQYNVTGTDYERDSRNALKILQFSHMRKTDLLKAIQSRDDTLIVLRNDKLIKQLSLSELLVIIANYKDLTEKLLDSSLAAEFTEEQNMLFAAKHLTLARKALTRPNMKTQQRVSLGVFWSEIAMEILKSTEVLASINNNHLAMLGTMNKEVALHIVKAPSLRSKLSSEDLAVLGEDHEEVAEYILNTSLITQFTFDTYDHFINLCHKHEKMVHLHFSRGLLAQLTHDQMAKLGKYLSIEKIKALKFHEVMPSFTAAQLLEIGKDNEALAMYILDTAALCDNLHSHYLADLGANSLKVAKRIFNTPALFEKVRNNLAQLVQEHEELVMQVLIDEALCNTFDGSELATFAQTHFVAAQYILENTALRDKLNVGHFHTIGAAFPSLVQKILALPITRRMNIFLIDDLTKKAKRFNDIIGLFALPPKLQQQSEPQILPQIQSHIQPAPSSQPRRSLRIQETEAKRRRLG